MLSSLWSQWCEYKHACWKVRIIHDCVLHKSNVKTTIWNLSQQAEEQLAVYELQAKLQTRWCYSLGVICSCPNKANRYRYIHLTLFYMYTPNWSTVTLIKVIKTLAGESLNVDGNRHLNGMKIDSNALNVWYNALKMYTSLHYPVSLHTGSRS